MDSLCDTLYYLVRLYYLVLTVPPDKPDKPDRNDRNDLTIDQPHCSRATLPVIGRRLLVRSLVSFLGAGDVEATLVSTAVEAQVDQTAHLCVMAHARQRDECLLATHVSQIDVHVGPGNRFALHAPAGNAAVEHKWVAEKRHPGTSAVQRVHVGRPETVAASQFEAASADQHKVGRDHGPVSIVVVSCVHSAHQ